MLTLVFRAGGATYALDARDVREIVPAVPLRALPNAPEYIRGLLNFRGLSVPVIDMDCLLAGRLCPDRLSARIILVHYAPDPALPGRHTLGLLCESVTDTRKIGAAALQPPGVALTGAPYLGNVATEKDGLLQAIRVNELLPADLRAILFVEASA